MNNDANNDKSINLDIRKSSYVENYDNMNE